MNPFLLKLKHIFKQYSDTQVLNDISLEIKQGTFVCFLGPSGCGKTTLLNIIAGLEKPSAGTVYLKDNDITQLSPGHRNLGMVFQNYALFPNMTVRDNIGYGLRGKQWTKVLRQDRINTLLDAMGLLHLHHAYPQELSGGQQQRVALARAVAPMPDLLLLDEPLSALDAKVRIKLREELYNIQRSLGITIIMVTHDQEEAMALADQIIVMNAGKIEQSGPPAMLYRHPSSRFVAEFIGSVNIVSFPEWNEGRETYVRYEHLRVLPVNERTTAKPSVIVFRVVHCHLMGAFYRLQLLYSDQKTSIYADIPHQHCIDMALEDQSFVAVSIIEEISCDF